ncbi:MAG TPA: hypothetical protein VIF64_15125 [Pyrinomonadaceae bacterium]|jgi:hypothetical protein
MNERALRLVTKSAKALVVFGILMAGCTPLVAQTTRQNQKPVLIETDKNPADETPRPLSDLEEEMRAKRAIRSAEKEYQDNLDRARDLSDLGASIVASFKQKKELDREDIRKLEKAEKLAKGIRRAAGGCEDEVDMDKPPKDLASAMDMLGELSKSLKEKVEKTPKYVISAAVIDEANVLLEVIRIVRTLPPKV